MSSSCCDSSSKSGLNKVTAAVAPAPAQANGEHQAAKSQKSDCCNDNPDNPEKPEKTEKSGCCCS